MQHQPISGSTLTDTTSVTCQSHLEPIPPKNRHEKPMPREKQPRLDALKLLIIEDHNPSQLVTNLLLRREGVNVRLVPSELQRIHNALEEKPDLIVLDMQVTGLNPMEVIWYLQRREISVPILAVCDDLSESLKQQLKEIQGLNNLIQSVAQDQLHRVIHESLSDTAGRPGSQTTESDDLWSQPQIQNHRRELIDKLPHLMEIVPELMTLPTMEPMKRLVRLLAEIGDAADLPELKQNSCRIEEYICLSDVRPEYLKGLVQELKEACTSICQSSV